MPFMVAPPEVNNALVDVGANEEIIVTANFNKTPHSI